MLRAFDAGRLFGAQTGTAAPWVLALHGWQRTHRDFDAVLGASDLVPALSSVALDLPGFGATPPPPEAWGSEDYAKAVAPVLAAMAEDAGHPIVVLGHSFGGRVAVRMGARWPELVAGLVLTGVPHLVDVGGRGRRAPLPFRLGRAAHRHGLIGDSAMEGLRKRYGSSDYRQASGVMRDVLVRLVHERYDEDLARLVGPVDLVWGELDAEVPLAGARRAAELLGPRAELTVCPGIGHLTPTEDPGALRRVLERRRPGEGGP